MSSVLAVVSKAVFEKQAKGLAPGSVWRTDRYASRNPNLEPLASGGDLYLVTVRPGDVLWLVAILRDPKADADGWKSDPNTTPIADITKLLPRFRFSTGKGVKADKGKLGMSLQTPRQLTDGDEKLLGGTPRAPPRTARPTGMASAAATTPGSARRARASTPASTPAPPGEPRLAITETVRKWLAPAKLKRPGRLVRANRPKHVLKRIDDALARADSELAPLAAKIRAWLADDDGRFTAAHDDETQVAASNLLRHFVHGLGFYTPDLAGNWARALGVEHAARLLLHDPLVDLASTRAMADERLVRATDDGGRAYRVQSALTTLIPYARDGAPEELARLKRELEPLVVALPPVAHVALARLVRDQETIDEIARRAAADAAYLEKFDRDSDAVRALIAESHDADAVEKILQTFKYVHFSTASSLAHALEHLPTTMMKRAMLALLPKTEKSSTPGDYKAYAQVLACIDDADVADYLACHAHAKPVQPVALEYFTLHPHHVGALDAASKQRGKAGAAATTILEAVRRHAPAGARSVAAAVATASAADVPAALREPQWKKKNAGNELVLDLPIPIEPVTQLEPDRYVGWVQGPLWTRFRNVASLKAHLESGYYPKIRNEYLEGLLADLGPEAAPVVIEAAAREPALNVGFFTHVLSPRGAVALASLLARTKEAPEVRAFLIEHADLAAKGLVPAAVGKDTKLRRAGRAGIAVVADAGKVGAVAAVARSLGIDPKLLEPDDALPAPGKMPPFARASALPAPVLAKSGAALPEAAVANLLAVLSVLPKDHGHAVVSEIKAACTQDSLDTFVWALVSDYVLTGGHARHDWALFAAGHLGSDEVARKIDTAARKWVQVSVALMQKSLDVLALIGTDVALSLLYERGLAAKFADTQQRARQILEQVAAQRGVEYAELEDILVPELGLDLGPIVLDYGARTFEVKLDEQLAAHVIVDGERKAAPPKPVKSDDREKAKAAAARFATLAEDLSHVARTQILRLERAMREARAWEREAWLREVVRHPLLHHLAPRIVWRVDGELVRVAEDGTFANEDDVTVSIDGATEVRIAHALDQDPDKWAKMARVFDDYEILQPFAQLGRETFRPKGAKYTDAVGRKVPWAAVDELLTGRGWIRTPPDGGTVKTLAFPLDRFGAAGASARLGITPGLTIGAIKARPEQTVGELELRDVTFGDLDPRVASELVRDAATLG